MCGENPEGRMEELCQELDSSGALMDERGNLVEVDAQQVAIVLGTSPQVAGKIMNAFDDIWERRIVKRKVVYIPRSDMH